MEKGGEKRAQRAAEGSTSTRSFTAAGEKRCRTRIEQRMERKSLYHHLEEEGTARAIIARKKTSRRSQEGNLKKRGESLRGVSQKDEGIWE